MTRCDKCDAPIRWEKTVAGKSIALDPVSVPAGDFRIAAAGVVRLRTDLEKLEHRGPKFNCHWDTCPERRGL